MDTILDIIKQFKMPLIIAGSAIALCIILGSVVPKIQEYNANKTPIAEIVAENDRVYANTEEMQPEDFKITAIHEDGAKTKLSSEYIELSRTTLNPVGDTTTVIVSYKEDSSIYCNVDVQIERTKIMGFECGYPDTNNVIAVLYSNGELCFEGSGDTLIADGNNYAWLKYDNMKNYPIKAITFEKKVKPRVMDYWFRDIATLTYVAPIPDSVQSMKGTFSGCTGLETMADWTKCDALLNISECYEKCTGLKYTVAIPKNVKKATRSFAGCSLLQKTPNMSQAVSLIQCENTFEQCDKLVSITMPPNVTNINGMFKRCTNLQVMPSIPTSVVKMKEAFSDCTALKTLSTIPVNVQEMESCFRNCSFIEGSVTINANPEKMGDAFKNACETTTLDLNGSSLILDAFANSCEYNTITVNGQKPIEEITSLAAYQKYIEKLEKEKEKELQLQQQNN